MVPSEVKAQRCHESKDIPDNHFATMLYSALINQSLLSVLLETPLYVIEFMPSPQHSSCNSAATSVLSSLFPKGTAPFAALMCPLVFVEIPLHHIINTLQTCHSVRSVCNACTLLKAIQSGMISGVPFGPKILERTPVAIARCRLFKCTVVSRFLVPIDFCILHSIT